MVEIINKYLKKSTCIEVETLIIVSPLKCATVVRRAGIRNSIVKRNKISKKDANNFNLNLRFLFKKPFYSRIKQPDWFNRMRLRKSFDYLFII